MTVSSHSEALKGIFERLLSSITEVRSSNVPRGVESDMLTTAHLPQTNLGKESMPNQDEAKLRNILGLVYVLYAKRGERESLTVRDFAA